MVVEEHVFGLGGHGREQAISRIEWGDQNLASM